MAFETTQPVQTKHAAQTDSPLQKQTFEHHDSSDPNNAATTQNKLYSDAYNYPVVAINMKVNATEVSDAASKKSVADTSDRTPIQSSLEKNAKPVDLMTRAVELYKHEGMSSQARQTFEEAIKRVDQNFSDKDVKNAQIALDMLKAGAYDDGTKHGEADKINGHNYVDGILDKALDRINYRQIYASALAESHQNSSAEQVLKDNVRIADELPKQLLKDESKQLLHDISSSDISRTTQENFTKTLNRLDDKDTGAINDSLSTRKDLAHFYISGKFDPQGPIKPEKALQVLDEAQAKAQKEFNHDLDKSDPTFVALKKAAIDLLPDNLKKERRAEDLKGMNPLTDAGVTLGAFVAVGLAGSLLSRNPAMAKALFTESGELGKAGALAGIGTAAGLSTGIRHAFIPDETWAQSAIHGVAGAAAVAAVLATKSLVTGKVFQGATESSAIERVAMEKGVASTAEGAVAGSKDLSASALRDVFAKRYIEAPQALTELAAKSLMH